MSTPYREMCAVVERHEYLIATALFVLYFRFLATGETYTSLAFSYRLGVTTISKLVPEVCKAIWDTFLPMFMKMPETPEEWAAVAEDFETKWQFPNCVGAIDGKHIVMKAPANLASVL